MTYQPSIVGAKRTNSYHIIYDIISELHTWSRLDRLLGSWLRAWYWPRNLSPAAILRNFFKSTTYRALVEI